MKSNIKLCLVGLGRAGMIHAHNYSKRISRGSISCLVEPDVGLLNKAVMELGVGNKFANFKDALEKADFDAIVVVTPTKYHKEIVVEAANAGKHIFCEKPMAMDESECDEMIEVAKKNNVKLQIGFMRRFDDNFVAAKERIDSDEIGDVVMVRSLTYGPSIPKPWMYDISKSNGPLAEVNSHDIDTLRWYTGSEFKEVYAIGGNYRCPEAKSQYPDFYDNVIMNALFKNGMQGVINGAQGVQYGYDSRCEILGTKGIVIVGSLDGCATVSCNVNGMNKPIVKSWTKLFENAYLKEDQDFIDCILEDRDPKATGIDGKMAVKVVNAGNRSIVEKKPIIL